MRRILILGAALLALFSPAFAADTGVPNMTAGGAMSDTDLIYCAQSSGTTDRKCTGAQAKTYVNTSAVRATTTTSEALANSDQNKLVTFCNASPVAASIAVAGGGGNFAAGWATSLKNLCAGTVTLTATTSTFNPGAGGAGSGAATITLLQGQGVDFYSNGTDYVEQPGKGSVVATNTLALATGAIASTTCTSAQTATATGLLTTDVVVASFNGDPTAVTGYIPLTTGMLTIILYPTANTFNVKVCNNTSSSITPGAITLNLKGVR